MGNRYAPHFGPSPGALCNKDSSTVPSTAATWGLNTAPAEEVGLSAHGATHRV